MSAPYTTSFQGAGMNRVQGGWLMETDPNWDWVNESLDLATRATDLVRNDPVNAALLNAKTRGEQGSCGLKFRSLVELDGDGGTSVDETLLRHRIDELIEEASAGRQIDAQGLCTRRELESQLSELAAVTGEAFAIRCFQPGRPGAVTSTCWKLLRRSRICNPPGEKDGTELFQGIALGESGPIGIWVGPPRRMLGELPKANDWTFVPWYDGNGLPCVIHRIGKREPGSYRGISMFAPNLYLAKQVKSTIDAYVVAKRIQACHPIFIKCADPAAAAKKDRNGVVWGPNTTIEPGKIYYIGEEGEISFPTWTFQGADMREFLDTLYRNQFASWGLPIDVVLAQLGKTNMAASRSAWLQYYRQCDCWQDDHIEQVTAIINANIIQEALLTGRLVMPSGMTLHQLMRGRWIRPPRSMPDPLKEANAVKAWEELGRDLTGLFAESGVDFNESIMQREEDERTMNAAGLGKNPSPESTRQRDAEFIERIAAAQGKISADKVEGITWPAVIAASAAVTAPGAFLQALASPTEESPDEADKKPEPEAAPPAEEPEDDDEEAKEETQEDT